MANSDTLLLWVIYLQFAFFLLPGIAWVVDRAIRGDRSPPKVWAAGRTRAHHSRFRTYGKARGRVRHA